jgi:hypothetical protein
MQLYSVPYIKYLRSYQYYVTCKYLLPKALLIILHALASYRSFGDRQDSNNERATIIICYLTTSRYYYLLFISNKKNRLWLQQPAAVSIHNEQSTKG